MYMSSVGHIVQWRKKEYDYQITRSCKLKRNRKHNGQNIMAKRKMAKVKTTIYKTKDRATGTPLKTWGELKWSGRVSSSCSTCGPVVLPLLQTRWYVMNEVRTGLLSRHVKHICGSVVSLSIRVMTKLPNSEQSYKGKVKTDKYINRKNQSTTWKLWKP